MQRTDQLLWLEAGERPASLLLLHTEVAVGGYRSLAALHQCVFLSQEIKMTGSYTVYKAMGFSSFSIIKNNFLLATVTFPVTRGSISHTFSRNWVIGKHRMDHMVSFKQ